MTRLTAATLALCALVVLLAPLGFVGVVPVDGQTDAGGHRIDSVSYAGDGPLQSGGGTDVWLSATHRFEVTLSSTDGLSEAAVCLDVGDDGAGGAAIEACEPASIPANGTRDVSVVVSAWPSNLTGDQTVHVLLRAPNETGDVLDRSSLSLTVLREDGDEDDDGLSNVREVEWGTGIRTPDTDGDGLEDGPEVRTYGTSPTSPDSDNDGLSDEAELKTHRTDPTVPDTDGDGLPDGRELSLGTNPNRADTDGDGLGDAAEVNAYESDATTADSDGDGLDDGAEVNRFETNPVDPDTDDDGLTDALEVNTHQTDPNELDTDGDGLDDGAEVAGSTDPTVADTDGDGLDDGAEVEQFGTDPLVTDTDGDGLSDGAEVEQFGTDPTVADTDGDGVSDFHEVNRGPLGRLSPDVLVGLLVVGLLGLVGLAYWAGARGHRLRIPRSWTGADDEAADDAAEAERDPSADTPPEFLSNRQRIFVLLDGHEGSIPQSDIVEETGWSKSKVSRVLSEMEADGEITKVTVGRGNLVMRPDDAPLGSRSPADE